MEKQGMELILSLQMKNLGYERCIITNNLKKCIYQKPENLHECQQMNTKLLNKNTETDRIKELNEKITKSLFEETNKFCSIQKKNTRLS